MGFIEGEARGQGALFPASLEELIPQDHFCRVIEAFVNRLDMQKLGFVRAEAAETGRPGYDPRDLLKLYLYGYLQQIRSSRIDARKLARPCSAAETSRAFSGIVSGGCGPVGGRISIFHAGWISFHP